MVDRLQLLSKANKQAVFKKLPVILTVLCHLQQTIHKIRNKIHNNIKLSRSNV